MFSRIIENLGGEPWGRSCKRGWGIKNQASLFTPLEMLPSSVSSRNDWNFQQGEPLREAECLGAFVIESNDSPPRKSFDILRPIC